MSRLLVVQQELVWGLYELGWSQRKITGETRFPYQGVRSLLVDAGGFPPRLVVRRDSALTLAEREEISRGLAECLSYEEIAVRLGRPRSTVWREVKRHGGKVFYRAVIADQNAWLRARRPKPTLLSQRPDLVAVIEEILSEKQWSPQQIAKRLKKDFPDNPEMHVSHETIYKSMFIQARGELKKDLVKHLRSGKTLRRPGSTTGQGRGQIPNMVNISQRPAEVNDRAVPGHWEGDLIIGAGGSAVATLVERWSRFVVLVALPEGKTTEKTIAALTSAVGRLPQLHDQAFMTTLTWDQGGEMSTHHKFTTDTKVKVFFCDPHSPWQRGGNKNTNGLLRQYLPRTRNLATVNQDELDEIATKLNTRPRMTLDWMMPHEKLDQAVALTA